MHSQKFVTPAKAGVQRLYKCLKALDSGFRRNDGKEAFKTFCKFIKLDEFLSFTICLSPFARLNV
jgi:hypothetical protein